MNTNIDPGVYNVKKGYSRTPSKVKNSVNILSFSWSKTISGDDLIEAKAFCQILSIKHNNFTVTCILNKILFKLNYLDFRGQTLFLIFMAKHYRYFIV